MNPTFRAGVVAGFVAGAAFVGMALMIVTSRPASVEVRARAPEPALPTDRVRGLEEENRRLSNKIAEMERAKPAAPAPTEKSEKPTETASPDMKERFAKLAEAGLAAFQKPEFADLLKAIKESGKPAIE